MALKSTYFLAQVNGVLCVASRSTDWNEPRYTVVHWPTQYHAGRLAHFFDFTPEEQRADIAVILRSLFTVARETPGSFIITHFRGERIQSIQLTYEEVPRPRIGKGTKLEWRDGRWHKCTPNGQWTTIEV